MNTEERMEALYKLLGSRMSRMCELSRGFTWRAAISICRPAWPRWFAAWPRLAMDLTTAKINQIESRVASRKAGLRRLTELTEEMGGYDAEDINAQYTDEAIAKGR